MYFLKPLKPKTKVIEELGWPVLSKEIAGKICGASPYCADFTDGDDGCCYWQQKEPVTQSPADTEGTE